MAEAPSVAQKSAACEEVWRGDSGTHFAPTRVGLNLPTAVRRNPHRPPNPLQGFFKDSCSFPPAAFLASL
jgi:hypothetical protein